MPPRAPTQREVVFDAVEVIGHAPTDVAGAREAALTAPALVAADVDTEPLSPPPLISADDASAEPLSPPPLVDADEVLGDPVERARARAIDSPVSPVAPQLTTDRPKRVRGERPGSRRKKITHDPLDAPAGQWVDAWSEIEYDAQYRAEESDQNGLRVRKPSHFMKIRYADGTAIDINIDDIDDGAGSSMQDLIPDHFGDGERVFPKQLSRGATPKLWDAKQEVLSELHRDLEFMWQTLPAINFILMMPANALVSGPSQVARDTATAAESATPVENEGAALAETVRREAPQRVYVELGAGDLKASTDLAKQGGRVIAIDPSAPAGAAIKDFEAAGGTFVEGTAADIRDGIADEVFQYFPYRIEGTGRVAGAGTVHAVEDAIRILKPDGVARFVTEDLTTARYLAGEASRKGLRTVLMETTAGAAAPGATGAGIPGFSQTTRAYSLKIYK